ncbi:MAG: hypothetical protein K0U34_03600, partial [Alphaproteobacteria bacterium]|nr:hypothetical protein [Alphaproteobacteria bacterium]
MKMRFLVALVFCGVLPGLSFAVEKAPTAVDLLFNVKHLDTLKEGDALSYRFERKVSDQKAAGEAFSDDIGVAITNVTPEDTKNVKLSVFSGDRARNPFVTPGMTGNPLLLWYLNRAVSEYSKLAGGSPNYHKSKFRNALGSAADVTPAKIDFEGKQIDGYKIKLIP